MPTQQNRQPVELVKFDIKKATCIAQELKLEGVLQQLAQKPDPTTMQEFLSCFTQRSAADTFLGHYFEQL